MDPKETVKSDKVMRTAGAMKVIYDLIDEGKSFYTSDIDAITNDITQKTLLHKMLGYRTTLTASRLWNNDYQKKYDAIKALDIWDDEYRKKIEDADRHYAKGAVYFEAYYE